MSFSSWKLEVKGALVAIDLICFPVQPFIVTFFLLFSPVQVMGFLVFLMGHYSTCSYKSSKKIFSKEYILLVLISVYYLYSTIFHYAYYGFTSMLTICLTVPTVFSLCMVTDHCFLHHVGSYNSFLTPLVCPPL